jgi:hypothetical protein
MDNLPIFNPSIARQEENKENSANIRQLLCGFFNSPQMDIIDAKNYIAVLIENNNYNRDHFSHNKIWQRFNYDEIDELTNFVEETYRNHTNRELEQCINSYNDMPQN